MDNESPYSVVMRDMITLALFGFEVMVIMLIPYVNPPGEEKSEKADVKTPGNVIVELRWPDDLDADVDLWVQAPGDVPVGYSNKGGVIFDLMRDDLGTMRDVTNLNYEMSFSRGIVAGEYTVNVHLYRDNAGVYPVNVAVVVSVKPNNKESARRILSMKRQLFKEGEEITVVRFTLDKLGDLVPGSVNSLFRPLRSASK